jgi:hypothetical protein
LGPLNNFITHKLFVELISRHSVPNKITNWRVFNDDQQIIDFLTCEGTFQNVVIGDEEHSNALDNPQSGIKDLKSNVIPKNVLTLENLFDLQDRFKKPTNVKTHSSSMLYEVMNLRIENDPNECKSWLVLYKANRQAYIRLFKEYKNVFAWTYDDVNAYDIKIIQHTIPMKKETKPF